MERYEGPTRQVRVPEEMADKLADLIDAGAVPTAAAFFRAEAGGRVDELHARFKPQIDAIKAERAKARARQELDAAFSNDMGGEGG